MFKGAVQEHTNKIPVVILLEGAMQFTTLVLIYGTINISKVFWELFTKSLIFLISIKKLVVSY